jgi:hypothetical protein
MTVRRSGAAIAALVLTMSLASCSDDIVCPGGTTITAPSISGAIVESRLPGGDSTVASVRCVSDPLPDEFAVFISGRQLLDIAVESPLSLLATLEDDDIIWQNGQGCSLRVTTDAGLATASVSVPGAFSVAAPADVALGDTLTITWRPSDGADYYTVRCVVRSAREDSLVLERSITDTVVVFEPDDISMAGAASGHVRAVAGPYPDGGSEGNVSGRGWGFFTVAYYDSLCLFGFSVNDPAVR